MEPTTIIAIVGIVLGIALLLFVAKKLVQAADARREQLTRDAIDHRAEAEANIAKAQDLAPEREKHEQAAEHHTAEAERHVAEAEQHQAAAEELQRRSELAGRAAARHDEKAAEAEKQLG
jgi:hypothetical protein